MAGRFDDPHAAWYVQQWRDEAEEESNPLLMWHKFKDEKAKPRPRLPRALPQGRCFADVGIVSLHTDLANTQRDLMVGMRSSPLWLASPFSRMSEWVQYFLRWGTSFQEFGLLHFCG